jgi:acyl-CoA thioester hydrolase
MLQTTTQIDVRFPDCDRMGIVHHAVYPIWYEVARMDFFKELGFSFTDMNALGVNPAMVDLHLQYKAPASYPQTVTVTTRMGQYAPKKLELFYELRDVSGGEPINTARTFHIWTGPDGKSYDMEVNLPDAYEKIKKAAE